MNSASLQFFATVLGKAKGTASNSALSTPLRTTSLTMTLSSTSSGASQFNQAFGPVSRTLTGGSSEELDLRSFTNSLQETSQLFAEIRLLYIAHSTSSTSSGITVGNATANQFRPLQLTAAATWVMLPGEFVIFGAPTTAAMACSAALRYLKVANNDGVNSAIYEIGVFGSIA